MSDKGEAIPGCGRQPDRRYYGLKILWWDRKLEWLGQIFELVPRSSVARDMAMDYRRFRKKMERPEKLTFGDAIQLAQLTDIPCSGISELIMNEIITNGAIDEIPGAR
jgi:hypothetical protein